MYRSSPDSGYADSSTRGGSRRRRHGIVRFALTIMAVAVVAAVALGSVFWVVGLAFHLLGLVLRVALIAAVAAFVWRRVAYRRHEPWV